MLISVGGLVVLMLISMVISSVFSLNPQEVRGINAVENWTVFRLIVYVSVLIFWGQICRLLTRSKVKNKDITENDLIEATKNREEDIIFLKTLWWKIGLVLAFFEIVFIQQFGL